MPSELLKEVALPLALFAVLFGMGLSLVPADFRRVILSPKAKIVGLTCQLVLLPLVAFTLALAITLGLLDSASIAMPAVVYSLFMFLSGGLIIWWFGRPNGKVAKTL